MARAPRGTSSKTSKSGRSQRAGSTKAASGSGRKARTGTKATGRTKAESPTKARKSARGKSARGQQQPAKSAARATTRPTTTRPIRKTREAPQKRVASRAQTQRRSEQGQGWVGMLASLATSPLARDIVADVLEAAVAALRKERTGLEALGARQLARGEQAAADLGSEMVAGTAALA